MTRRSPQGNIPRVLVTGFEPFDGGSVNPSQQLVQALAEDPPPGLELETAVLPVAYARAAGELRAALRSTELELVVCFGQANGRTGISLERFAHNLDDQTKIDNEGASSGAEIDSAGPVAYRSTLPVDELVERLRVEGIPAGVSHDAGGFLCNHVFYVLMQELEQHPGTIGGFVHLPLLPEQALEESVPSMTLDTLLRAARVIVGSA